MSLQINIKDKVEFYPVVVNNKYEARIIVLSDGRTIINWEYHLFSTIENDFSASEIKEIEELILKQFKLMIKDV